jgi:ABC-type glycerol-3-phosphate transport system substrate-binding protein
MKLANKQALSSLSLAALMALSGALVGCGGDGDDGSADPFVTELDISAANSNTRHLTIRMV